MQYFQFDYYLTETLIKYYTIVSQIIFNYEQISIIY